MSNITVDCLYLIFFAFCMYFDFFYIPKRQRILVSLYQQKKVLTTKILIFVLIGIVFWQGMRNPYLWLDSYTYQSSFVDTTNDLMHFSFKDEPLGYTEKGYYLLCSIIKTIANNSEFYFFCISAICCILLYENLQRFSVFPIIGLGIYMARFMLGRDMNQMRSAIAIYIIIWISLCIKNKRWWYYLLSFLLAYSIHHSAIVFLPFLLFRKIKISKEFIVLGICTAFGVEILFGNIIESFMRSSKFVSDLASSYVRMDSEKAYSSSLLNPMIYYQIFVLLVFTFGEHKLSKLTPYYYILRNGYFYSTVLLIVLCRFAIVAGRTSTVFATYEIFIIPMSALLFSKKNRWIPFLTMLILFFAFFYKNYNPQEVIVLYDNV